MSETYYDVLGVESDASQEAIRDAYREKVKEYHPDVSDHPDAEERFKRVKRAEIVLADPEERSTYDRLGHDAYVDGDDPEPNQPTEDEVRWAAAKAAQGDHDAGGGPSAGWRQRERRARQRNRAAWFTGEDSGDPFDDLFDGADSDSHGTGRNRNANATPDGGSGTAEPAGTVGKAATDGWGGTEPCSSGHAVHEWTPEGRSVGVPRPDFTQDDAVLLVSSLLLYPILLFLTASTAFPLAARVALGLCAIALVGYLLPRPAFGLPVFGTWSILVPAFLLGFGVSPISAVAIVMLGGVWLPLGYSIAVAMVLAR